MPSALPLMSSAVRQPALGISATAPTIAVPSSRKSRAPTSSAVCDAEPRQRYHAALALLRVSNHVTLLISFIATSHPSPPNLFPRRSSDRRATRTLSFKAIVAPLAAPSLFTRKSSVRRPVICPKHSASAAAPASPSSCSFRSSASHSSACTRARTKAHPALSNHAPRTPLLLCFGRFTVLLTQDARLGPLPNRTPSNTETDRLHPEAMARRTLARRAPSSNPVRQQPLTVTIDPVLATAPISRCVASGSNSCPRRSTSVSPSPAITRPATAAPYFAYCRCVAVRLNVSSSDRAGTTSAPSFTSFTVSPAAITASHTSAIWAGASPKGTSTSGLCAK
mmetsp:Transcript_13285/g.28384  ORF Transcript_13285/g.28384 Transcript_13285/m.28384 type:complete len:337 (+) Transcript_13285:1160-2170(+)